MSSKKDYIPHNNSEFNSWFNTLTLYVSDRCGGSKPDWDHIPKRELDELKAAFDDWSANYSPTLKPHTSDVTRMRDLARGRAEKIIRPFVQRHLYCDPPVSSGDRVNVKLRDRDRIRTDRSTVGEEVQWHFDIRGIRQVHTHFRVLGASGKAKPEGYDVVVAYEVRDASAPPPERPEDLSRRVNASRTPFTLEFDETERGKKVYAAMAWQNDRKILGSWSAIQWTFIP